MEIAPEKNDIITVRIEKMIPVMANLCFFAVPMIDRTKLTIAIMQSAPAIKAANTSIKRRTGNKIIVTITKGKTIEDVTLIKSTKNEMLSVMIEIISPAFAIFLPFLAVSPFFSAFSATTDVSSG